MRQSIRPSPLVSTRRRLHPSRPGRVRSASSGSGARPRSGFDRWPGAARGPFHEAQYALKALGGLPVGGRPGGPPAGPGTARCRAADLRPGSQYPLRGGLRLGRRGPAKRGRKRELRGRRPRARPAVVPGLDPRLLRGRQLRALRQRVHRQRGRQGAPLGQVRLRHLANRPRRRPYHQRALRLPGRHPRQRGRVEPARFRLLQRHEPLSLSRRPGLQFSGDGDGEDPARLAGRHRHGTGLGRRVLPRRDLSRPGG